MKTPNSAIFSVDLSDFEQKVLQKSQQQVVLVDFWADWCSPCRVIDPVLQQVVGSHNGEILLAKLEVDAGENMKLAGRYAIRGFPTIILFRHDEEQDRFSGARPARYVEDFIAPFLSGD